MSSTSRFWTPQLLTPSGPFTDGAGGPVKPPRWAWNRDRLEPAGRSLARGLVALLPLWGEGPPVELTTSVIADVDTMDPQIAPYGISRHLATTGVTFPTEWPTSWQWTWDTADDGITIAVFVDLEVDQAGSQGLLAMRDGYSTGLWELYTANGNLAVLYRNASGPKGENESGGNGSAANTSPIYGRYNLYAYSSPPAAAGQLYRNGTKLTMANTNTAAPGVPGSAWKLILASAEKNNATQSAQGDYLLAAKWNRPLTDDEHALLAADPFVLLRQDTAIAPYTIPTSGPFTDIKKGTVKPPRWAWEPSLLEPEAKNLARGLVGLVPIWNASGPVVEVTKAELSTIVGGDPVWTPAADGMSVVFDGTDKEFQLQDADRFDLSNARYADGYSLHLRISSLSTLTNRVIYAFAAGTAAGEWQSLFWSATTTSIAWRIQNGTDVTFTGWTSDGTIYDLVATWDGTNTRVYADGQLVAGPISNPQPISKPSAVPTIGKAANKSAYQWDGSVNSFAQWDRCLTADEVSRLAADPFILLRRDYAIPTVLPTGGGGTIHVVDIIDTVDATDSTTSVKASAATLTESVTTTDTTTLVSAIARELTDPITTTDTTTSVKAVATTITDPVDVTDTTQDALSLAVTITDPITTTDVTTLTKSSTLTITDPIATTDTTTRVHTATRSIIDPVDVTDTVTTNAGTAHSVTITESVTTSDLVTRVSPASRILTDSIATTDAVTAAKTITVEITDAVTTTDSTDVAKAILIGVTDPVTTTDLTTRTASFFRVIDDGVDVLDPVTRIAPAAVTITDLVVVTDTTTGVLTVVGLITCIGFRRHPDASIERNPLSGIGRTPPPGTCSP